MVLTPMRMKIRKWIQIQKMKNLIMKVKIIKVKPMKSPLDQMTISMKEVMAKYLKQVFDRICLGLSRVQPRQTSGLKTKPEVARFYKREWLIIKIF